MYGGKIDEMNATHADTPLLEVQALRVSFPTADGMQHAVDGVSFALHAGETLGIIGESGCGKTVTGQAILRIVPPPGHAVARAVRLVIDTGTVDLMRCDPDGDVMRAVRGRQIGIVFQDPATRLTPVLTIGAQLDEMLRRRTLDPAERRTIALELLDRVGMPASGGHLAAYPHQLSGGLAQRAALAIALCCQPRILIADEPTTGLDPVTRGDVLALIARLQAELRMAVIHISHDLTAIGRVSDRVAVMYAGRIVEVGSSARVLGSPMHPYTARLLAANPPMDRRVERFDTVPGTMPSGDARWRSCAFADRCDEFQHGVCNGATPALVELEAGHAVRCFLHSSAEERTRAG